MRPQGTAAFSDKCRIIRVMCVRNMREMEGQLIFWTDWTVALAACSLFGWSSAAARCQEIRVKHLLDTGKPLDRSLIRFGAKSCNFREEFCEVK